MMPCESCGGPADVRLDDGSRWCISCDTSARRLGYDNRPAQLVGGLVKPMGDRRGLPGAKAFVRRVHKKNAEAAARLREALRRTRGGRMSIVDLICGRAVLISGVEQDPDEPEFDRVYLGPRWEWKYALAPHGTVHADAMGHTFTTVGPDAVIYCDEERRDAARTRGGEQ